MKRFRRTIALFRLIIDETLAERPEFVYSFTQKVVLVSQLIANFYFPLYHLLESVHFARYCTFLSGTLS